MSEQLEPGSIGWWRVLRHFPFGIEVEALDHQDVRGIVDLIYISKDKSVAGPEQFPAINETVEAVVQGYMPDGQLRLSMLPEDVQQSKPPEQLGD